MNRRGDAQPARLCQLFNPLGQYDACAGYRTVSNDDLTQGDTHSYIWLDIIFVFVEMIMVIGLE